MLYEVITNLRLDILGFDEATIHKLRKAIREPYGMVLVSDADEIPRPTSFAGFRDRVGIVENRLYYYRFNLQMEAGADAFLRITSYNVCYTKLLRTCAS